MPLSITTVTGIAKNYIEIFFRRKWLLIAPSLLFAGLGFSWSFFIPPMYRSSAIILIQEAKTSNPLISGLTVSTTVKSRVNTLVKIILSRPVLEQTLEEIGLDNLENIQKEQAIEELRKGIDVNLIGGSLLKIECAHRDPVIAQKVANSISSIFIQKNLELMVRETDAGIDFLERQREIYAQKLTEAERALREFKTKYQDMLSRTTTEKIGKLLGVPTFTMNTELLRYTTYKQDLLELNLRLKELMAKREELKKMLEREPQYIVSEKTADPIINQLKKELAQKQIQLTRLEIDATPDHPLVKRLKQEVEDLRKKIDKKISSSPKEVKEVLNPVYQKIKSELGELDSEIESLKTRIELTQIYLEDHAQKIKMIPVWEEQLLTLQRESQIASQIYSDIVKRLETAYITRRLEIEEKGTHFRIVEPPEVPARPFKPNRKLMATAGFTLGFLLGLGMIFMAEYTDHSFTEVNQLRNFLDIPVVGYISQILTVEEAQELKSKRIFYLVLLLVFIIFTILGGAVYYFLSVKQ